MSPKITFIHNLHIQSFFWWLPWHAAQKETARYYSGIDKSLTLCCLFKKLNIFTKACSPSLVLNFFSFCFEIHVLVHFTHWFMNKDIRQFFLVFVTGSWGVILNAGIGMLTYVLLKSKDYEKFKPSFTHILMVNCMETRSGLGV